MLRSRVIPCLLLHNKGLYKTVNFGNPTYIGDPINAVKIFNDKEVDEILILDIDATVNDLEPNYSLIEKLANECRMPICIGGGIKNVNQASKIIKLGVEKIAISSAIIEDLSIASSVARIIGKQSTVAVIDVKKNNYGKYIVFTHNGKKKIDINLEDLVCQLEKYGVGEIVINSIDNDGMMNGYDLKLVEKIREIIDVPITILGGAGKKEHIFDLTNRFGIIGAAAGSLFVFRGEYKAVLLNYLSSEEKINL